MLERLPAWVKNKWVLFSAGCVVTLLLGMLIFTIFLRGPFASVLTSQAQAAMKSGNYDKAISKFSSALELKKNREEIYLGYSQALSAKKRHTEAVEILNQGIDRLGGAEALYLAKAETLTKSGKIGASADFLDGIMDSYINKKIQASRPGDLQYSPQQGKYGKTQKVTIQVRPGETVYYTLTGEDPSLSSAVYKEPITVSASCTLTAVAVSENGLVSPRLKLTYEIDNANEAIQFTDRKIEKMVRDALERPSGALYASHLAGVKELFSEGIDGEIRSLKDLEYLPNLQRLYINDELLIEDYTPLSSLTGLQYLSMSGCALSDTDLGYISGLTGLLELSINNNKITSLSNLSELTALEFLNASENELTTTADIAPLTNLRYLHLTDNSIYDLSGLSGLGELLYLDISNNSVSDLEPLAGLTKLEELYLRGNRPSNVKKLSSLPALTRLDLSSCGLASLSIVNDFKALQALFATDNEIASLSTFSKQLSELYISNNPLADLSPLKSQTGLTVLEAADTKITDVACLAGNKTLVSLDISGTSVTDATVLKDCAGLNFLVCSTQCATTGLPAAVDVVIK